MVKQSNYTIGLEISTKGYKLVQRNIEKNEINLLHAEVFPGSPIEDDSFMAKSLKEGLKLIRKTIKTRETVFSVPLQAAQIRFMQLDPAMGDLRQQIIWELEQQTIGRAVEPVLDWVKVSQSEIAQSSAEPDTFAEMPSLDEGAEKADGAEEASAAETASRPYSPATYLSVSTDKKLLASWNASIKKGGFDPIVCDVDSLALSNLFTVGYPEEQAGSNFVIDVSPERVLIVWMADGRLVDADCVVSLDWSGAEAASKSLLKLKQRLKDMTNGHSDTAPAEKFFLSGEIASDTRLRDIVFAEADMKGEILDPFRAVAASDDISSQSALYGPAFAVSVGLTLRGTGEDE
ncbi:MAG: hypothetical protein JNL74_13505 [Fibrobacteres bacterium]|nr:hypothetical protein [Fibrobacterota bacterium]